MTRFPFAPPPATAAAACVERRPCTRPRRGAPRWATTPATACRRRRRARRRSRPHRRHSRRPRPRRRYQSHRYAATPATSVSRGGANPRMALAPLVCMSRPYPPSAHPAGHLPPPHPPSSPPPRGTHAVCNGCSSACGMRLLDHAVRKSARPARHAARGGRWGAEPRRPTETQTMSKTGTTAGRGG